MEANYFTILYWFCHTSTWDMCFLNMIHNLIVMNMASVLPMNIQDWFLLWLTSWISLQSKELSRVFSSTTVWKHQFFHVQPSLWFNSHISNMTTGKNIALAIWTFVDKLVSLLFNILPRFVIAFLPRSKYLLISWLQSPSTVISEAGKIKYITTSKVG